jgi:hypothetical protein
LHLFLAHMMVHETINKLAGSRQVMKHYKGSKRKKDDRHRRS